MAYIPGCRHDLFISYACDNDEDGWVEHFVEDVGREVRALLGKRFVPGDSVYFAERALQLGQSFPDALATAAMSSAVLVPILSNSYLGSEWCNREREWFFAKLPAGARQQDCLAPIIFRPFDKRGLAIDFLSVQHISFLDSYERPLVPRTAKWRKKISEAAEQIAAALRRLRQVHNPVYVGRSADSDSARELRERCCNEIEGHGFRTIPEHFQAFANQDTVQARLGEASLAVHFLGGADEAALEAIEISVEICRGPTLLFQPYGVELSSEEVIWLRHFEQKPASSTVNCQRVEDKNEQELIAIIIDKLIHSRPKAALIGPPLQLALVCEFLDISGVRQLKADLLNRRAMNVDFPSFLGTRLRSIDRLRAWRKFLESAQALVFYHGEAKRESLQLIWRLAEQRNSSAKRSWFLAPPQLREKRLRDPGALWDIDQLIRLLEASSAK